MAYMPKTFRQTEATRAEYALELINRVDRPKLYFDHNGRGRGYFSLKYIDRDANGKAVQKTLYIGRLCDNYAKILQDAVVAADLEARAKHMLMLPLAIRIRLLRAWQRAAKPQADRIARESGMHFKGYQLRRLLRGNKTGGH
jgi:hypothetical protein